jgi:PIN domain nuclease of toxin-antitoxin system
VTDRLLLDTHIALWLDSGDHRLRPSTRSLIDDCWQNGGTILLSAVTAWEIALLVDTGRMVPLRRGSSASSRVPASRRCHCPTGPPAAAIGCIISSTATRRTDS